MKRKVLAAFLMAAMTISMVGCSKPADTKKSEVKSASTASTKSGSMTSTMSMTSKTSSASVTSTTEPAGEKTVVAAMPAKWSDLYPMGEDSHYDNIIFDQVYDALVKQNGDGSYKGELAESWEVNKESTELKFKLKSGIKWHNGDAFSANDIVESFKIYSNPDIKTTSRYYLRYLDGCDEGGAETNKGSIAVSAPSDTEVVFKFKKPTFVDTVLDDLSHVYIVEGTKFKDMSSEELGKAETWANPMGTGAFIYDSMVDGERVEFKANKEYYDGAPEFDKLVVRVVDSANLLAGLMNGEIDTVLYGGLPLDDFKLAKEQENLVAESVKSQSYQLLIFNASKKYLNEKVRQALSMAIDRKSLVDKLLQGEGEPVITPISSINPYYNADVDVWYDVDQAKKQLEEAKFPFDQTLKFYVPTGNSMREKAAAIIAENLKAVGVKTEIVQVDFPAFMEAAKNGDEDLGIVGSGGSMNPSESSEMLQGAFNLCKIEEGNKLVKLLNKGDSLFTMEERKPVFDEFQVEMKKISPYGYLFTTNSLVAYNKRLSGVNPANFSTFNWEIHTWKVSE